ncbi:MAG: hypothetical protein O4965_15575 [Trichodesmium sp. St19_bin1]|jgi:hypothetical protein|nr:hypothetical protein [Trichodesmium sp. St19_bin1]
MSVTGFEIPQSLPTNLNLQQNIITLNDSGLTQRHLCKCEYRIRIIKNTPDIEAIRKS